jgi:thymidylate synthase (FAD)
MSHDNHVELIGYYGSDETHALSAWTSTKRELTQERKPRVASMLKMLAEAGHHTPFEKSSLHFLVDVETASHIHIIKHRIGVSVNAESARYREMIEDKWYIPDDWPHYLQVHLDDHCHRAFERYHFAVTQLEPLVGRKRAKESARFFLPYATQGRMDVMFNWRSFMWFQKLRNDNDAQDEIHTVAAQMLDSLQVRATGKFNLSLAAFGY